MIHDETIEDDGRAIEALEKISRLVHEFTLDPDRFQQVELAIIQRSMREHGIQPPDETRPPRTLDSYLPQYRRYHELYPEDGPVAFLLARIAVTAARVLQADEMTRD